MVLAAFFLAILIPILETWKTKDMLYNLILICLGLISTMIESCPQSTGSVLPPFKQVSVNMNNIVKCMLKKGLITDLARVPHALDLSSPGMAATINAAMKPLGKYEGVAEFITKRF